MILKLIISISLLLVAHGAICATSITLWSYYEFGPFTVNAEKKEGLSFDLARLMSAESDGIFEFKVSVIPRKRLNSLLKSKAPGAVLWVHPAWFGDIDRKHYLWTPSILVDRNEIISQRATRFEYDGPESLIGRILGGVAGHNYVDIDPLVKSGKIAREDSKSEEQNIRKLLANRFEVTILPQTAALYYEKTLNLSGRIHYSEKPHTAYSRHILVQPELSAVHEYIKRFVENRDSNTQWQALLQKYGL